MLEKYIYFFNTLTISRSAAIKGPAKKTRTAIRKHAPQLEDTHSYYKKNCGYKTFFQWKIQKLMKAMSIYISFDRHIAGQQKLKGIR